MALWTPPTGVQLMQQHKKERVIVLSDGSRVKVTVEGTEEDGYVQHTEHKDGHIDAMAIPKTVRYSFKKV
jgi:hypothetical protein